MGDRETIEVDKRYFEQLVSWIQHLYYANIACNSDGITETVKEIANFYWMAEGETLDDKIEALYKEDVEQ